MKAVDLSEAKRRRQRKAASPADAGGLSDDALALAFSDRHGAELRYVAQWGRWLRWNGSRWRFDDTLDVLDLAREVCRDAAKRCEKPREAVAVAAKRTVAAVEYLARADRRHAATVDQWDQDPWLLNTPAGVVDLRTGQIRAHAREDYLTKMTATFAAGDCPTWRAYLETVTGGDGELRLFLQRVAGYCLTAQTSEHALFFLYGPGGNGKTTFVDTLSSVLGGYSATAPIDAFLETHAERHPTELAGLRGARMVAATETESGRRWDQAKVKALTGGDRIAARFMRQDYFEFVPTFKLVITGNHRPALRSVDEAMRRRLNVIPFTVTIPEGERDKELPAKLQAEAGGILAWAIKGAAEWAMQGLQPPHAVQAETERYLEAEDLLRQFVVDECICGGDRGALFSVLYTRWKSWCERNGEKPGSAKALSQRLEAAGYRKRHTREGRWFDGIQPAVDGGSV